MLENGCLMQMKKSKRERLRPLQTMKATA
jgi:CbiT: precorrin-6Y C5,15-methyltransferase (decarboxylating), CbiT subunit